MPRSSFSRNPLLRVSRPVSACSRCRSAKVKCDGKLPACTACEKAGRESECSAANDQFARGKERSYVAALELRIEKLQRRLQFAKSRKDSVALHETDEPTMVDVDRRDSLASIRAAIHRKAARVRENNDVNSIVSDFGLLSVDATSRDFEPSASNITFARLVLAATTNDRVPQPTHPVLPPRPVANAIIQYFMSNVYQLFTCFSDTALFTILHDVYEQHESSVKDSAYWLLYMVLAIGSTAQSQSINDEHYRRGVNFVAKALTYADRALAPGYLTQIQSLLLLTLYAMLDPAHFDSWHLIGFTARAVLDLGLHQDPPVSSASDKSLLDMRRKVFYCTYALDRAISMAHARSFSFTDDSVNVAFPTTQSPSQKPSSMADGPQSANPSLLLFQLRRAQSFWYQELYQSEPTPLANPLPFLWQMCLEMREWGQSLPESLPVGTRRMFEQELWYSYVYCIAPSARAPHITDYGRTLIFEYSLAYLNSMYETAYGGLNCAFYTYQDALKVYFMANQLIAVLRGAEEMLLLDMQVPPPLSPPGTAPPPPIPRRSGPTAMDNGNGNGNNNNNNVDRSLWCLEHISATLDLYGARWGDATMLRQGFERISGETIQRLRSRRQMRNVGLSQPQRPTLQTVVHTVSPPAVMKREDQQLPSDMRWPAIDGSQTAQDDGLC